MEKVKAKIVGREEGTHWVDTSHHEYIRNYSSTGWSYAAARPISINVTEYGPYKHSGHTAYFVKMKYQVPSLGKKLYQATLEQNISHPKVKDDAEVIVENGKPYLLKVCKEDGFFRVPNGYEVWRKLNPNFWLYLLCFVLLITGEIGLNYINTIQQYPSHTPLNVRLFHVEHLSEVAFITTQLLLFCLSIGLPLVYFFKTKVAKIKIKKMFKMLDESDEYCYYLEKTSKWKILFHALWIAGLIYGEMAWIYNGMDKNYSFYENYNKQKRILDNFGYDYTPPQPSEIQVSSYPISKQFKYPGTNMTNYTQYPYKVFSFKPHDKEAIMVRYSFVLHAYIHDCLIKQDMAYSINNFNYMLVENDPQHPNCQIQIMGAPYDFVKLSKMKVPETQWINLMSVNDAFTKTDLKNFIQN